MTTTGCLPIGPETEKRHGQRRRERERKETKKEARYFSARTLFPFFFSLCVFKTGLMVASGLGRGPKEVRMCVRVSMCDCVCVCVVVHVLVWPVRSTVCLYLSH